MVDAVRGGLAAVDDVLEGLKALAGELLADVVEGVDCSADTRAG
ncbi:hypothetical protein AB0D71_20750 [Streptomyces avermitilis]